MIAVAVLLYHTVPDLSIAKASGEGFVLFHALGLVGGGTSFFSSTLRGSYNLKNFSLDL